jgi:hypothetical protein
VTELFAALRDLAGKGARLLEKTMDQKAYHATAATILKFWMAHGFTFEQACGLLAQADAESSLKPGAVGDHGQAFGIHQWHADRVAAIKRGCGVDLHKLPPLEDQLKAALWELQGPEKRAWQAIREARTAYDAGYAGCRFWERPASALQSVKRGQKAESWAGYFHKNPVA